MDRRGIAVIFLLLLCTRLVSSASPDEYRIEDVPTVMDGLIFQYRLVARDFLDMRCNFSPSCSHYGQTVLSSHGPVIGTMMALERWTRCHSTAGRLDYYSRCGTGSLLSDPLEIDEGNVIWDSLLLPF
ncbi:MAG: membrane protein insertion efficiency factor YidD [Candidatus Aegiribacteria sp.]